LKAFKVLQTFWAFGILFGNFELFINEDFESRSKAALQSQLCN
jgi:hypothetical protein